MNYSRVFADKDIPVTWEKRDVKITDPNGNITFEQKDVECPSSWSDNAVKIVASKYFKKIDGVMETSVKQLVSRVVDTISKWGWEYKYFSSRTDQVIFADELTWLLTNQYASFNSPIWFNFGVPGREQQAAACFLLGLEDNSQSIRDWTYVESEIFKGGSGSGINISPLRHKNAPLSAGGVSSGPLSFTKSADANAGVWKSGGTTRRAATLRRMDVTHPDIKEFITCKSEEEKKAKILIDAGYGAGIDGEAYSTVAYQNMNHSVGVTDEFMERVIDLQTDPSNLMQLIATNAWQCGDPGLQFDDVINEWNTIPNSGRINTSNPCGEYLSTDWSSCLLASLNLIKYNKGHTFDFDLLAKATHIMTTALDIIICGADYPDPRFKETAQKQRQIGLGYSNLGALLMSRGLAYGSEQGRSLAAAVTSTMTAEAYIQSALMAKELGAFEDYAKNSEAMLSIIEKHQDVSLTKWPTSVNSARWQAALGYGKQYGYRNSVVTLIAPTGTISFMMDCDTTGIEPEFAQVKYKSLVGGGKLILVSSTVEQALLMLNYTDDQIADIKEHITKTGTIEGSVLKDKDLPVFDCAVKPENGVRFIDYHDHLKMLAAVQPFLSMGISKTINMPADATIADVYDVYIAAWKMKIKSVTIYRDGCKESQPLNVGSSAKVKAPEPEPSRSMRKSLARERKSLTHKVDISGFECYITAGLYEDGTPGELFISASKVGSTVSGLLDSFAIAISIGLQYGAPLEALIEKFTNSRFEPAGFTDNPEIRMTTSVVDYTFRWLQKKFIDKIEEPHLNTPIVDMTQFNYPAAHRTGETCRCGTMMVRTGTCLACPECGSSAGGCGA